MFFERITKKRLKLDPNSRELRVGFPNLADRIDLYIARIERDYNVTINTTNLKNIILFLQDIYSMSKEEFLERVPRAGNSELSQIYLLLRGDERTVDLLLYGAGWTVLDKNRGNYRQFISNATKKRLEKNITRLKNMLDAQENLLQPHSISQTAKASLD